MILVGFILLTYIMGPEWCYQGEDHDEFVERYYKSLKHESAVETTSNALKENLAKEHSVVELKRTKEERPFQKKADAKDAVYFINM